MTTMRCQKSRGYCSSPATWRRGRRDCERNTVRGHERIPSMRSCASSIDRCRRPMNNDAPEALMSALRPRHQLETHNVTNQPPPFEDVNLFTSDVALQAAVAAAGGEMHAERLSVFGARTGSAETAAWAMQANVNPPQLRAFDPYGRRIDEVEFHPAYHRLMALGVEAGVASGAWSGGAGGHVLHAAPAGLKFRSDVAALWTPKIVASRYDLSSQPMHGKSGVTIGMAMTEKQG